MCIALPGTQSPRSRRRGERLLETAHIMVDAANPRQRLVLYTLEVRLVHHIFRKADASRGSFKTQADIGCQFVAELSHLMQRSLQNKLEAE